MDKPDIIQDCSLKRSRTTSISRSANNTEDFSSDEEFEEVELFVVSKSSSLQKFQQEQHHQSQQQFTNSSPSPSPTPSAEENNLNNNNCNINNINNNPTTNNNINTNTNSLGQQCSGMSTPMKMDLRLINRSNHHHDNDSVVHEQESTSDYLSSNNNTPPSPTGSMIKSIVKQISDEKLVLVKSTLSKPSTTIVDEQQLTIHLNETPLSSPATSFIEYCDSSNIDSTSSPVSRAGSDYSQHHQQQIVNINNNNNNNITPKTELTQRQILIIFSGLMVSLSLSSLDLTIVATALPAIVNDLGGFDKLSWVVTIYLLTSTSSAPLFGKFSDIFGSLLCATSYTMTMLIAARAIQGLGGGGLMSAVMIVMAEIVPLRQRGKYQGLIGAVYAVSSVIGPLIGGSFTDNVTWRWAFWINLPLGAIALCVVFFALRLPQDVISVRQGFKCIDFVGTISLVVSVIGFLLALSWGGVNYSWQSPVILSLFFGICAALFLGSSCLASSTMYPSISKWSRYDPLYKEYLVDAYASALALVFLTATPFAILSFVLTIFIKATKLRNTLFRKDDENNLGQGGIKETAATTMPNTPASSSITPNEDDIITDLENLKDIECGGAGVGADTSHILKQFDEDELTTPRNQDHQDSTCYIDINTPLHHHPNFEDTNNNNCNDSCLEN
ncbi:major facilitator superfamily protein [Cavenderia fasciculata]|uniref:Major facilitator superfamily protein n=1 Tax=Cavenderia fasciculata TaxID=261658 RepID=F4PJ29_CACFS|nr:major facilitator superfamily protein [Cavenderia fasciculata]EGG24315.1 major facilitator superfamily protein [Cavenderia fasciculata]|eukprot:XP_004362166.1 major facilitator superfamily protein [Cavenderia fasciculata]